MISIILSVTFSIGKSDLTRENLISDKDLTVNYSEKSSLILFSKGLEKELLMEDSVCVSVTQDTFFVNAMDNIDSYSWTVPTGAIITSTIGDTMIVVDWRNSVTGLVQICLETNNTCGTSAPTCLPIRVLICNDPPDAINDVVSTPSNTSILIPVQNNDSDPDNDQITTSLNPSDLPSNGSLTLVGNDIRYIPNNNFTGPDQFTYTICDNGFPVFCDTAQVDITVINSAPIAIPDDTTTMAGVATVIPVQNNDSDSENNILITSLDANNGPANGTVSTNGQSITYTANSGFTGIDSLYYVICDNGIPFLCDTAIVTIFTTNQAPVAQNDRDTTNSNTAITVAVQNNDTDPENGNLTTTLNTANSSSNGTLSILGDDIQYTPNLNFTGTDDFEYIICDDASPILCDTALVTIVVLNIAPIAVNDFETILSGSSITINVQNNDSDSENGNLITTLDPSAPPLNGMASVSGDDIFYTPNAGFAGTEIFNYIICDDGNPILCDTASITISTSNRPPIAVDNINLTQEGIAVSGDAIANDFDLEGDAIFINQTPINIPSNGTVLINANGTYTYTPNPNFIGDDAFIYEICDNGFPSLCDTATVSIKVIENDHFSNDPPVAIDDHFITSKNTTINANIIENDGDPDQNPININTTAISNVNNGSLTILPNGTFSYTPDNDFIGEDIFEYRICDNAVPSLCDTAQVKITIIEVHPSENHTFANEDAYLIMEDMPLIGNVLANDTDSEGDVQNINTTPISNTSNGALNIQANGNFTYTPALNYNGNDQFQYSICDTGTPQACDTTTVFITITPVNDAPIAVNDIFNTNEDNSVNGNVLPNDTDTENDNLTVNTVPIDNVDNGTLTLNPNGTFTYTPDPNFNGNDQFQYQICDDGVPSLCDTATVTISVTPVNDKPVANDDAFTTDEDTPISNTVLPNDTDIENNNLTVNTVPIDDVDNGTLTLNPNGTFAYTPNPNFNGIDQFQYQICDDGVPSLCDTATVIITINPINDKPVANNDAFTTDEDTPISNMVLPNDTDTENDNLTVNTIPIDNVNNGILTLNPNGTFTYTPDPHFNGVDQFQYEVCDDGIPSLCDTATVIITVNPINDKPVANDDVFLTDEDNPVSGNVLPNDTDIENDNLTVNTVPIDNVDNGTLVLNPNGTFTYTPDPNFNGNDQFQYQICDDGVPSLCDTATVFITINFENDKPVANDDAFTTNEDTPINNTVLPNDTDTENHNLVVSSIPVDNVNNGILILNTDGTFTYTPDPHYNGNDQFQYQICDDGVPSLCDTATVFITIIPINDKPIANDDSFITNEDTPISNTVLPNDSDIENDNLTVNTVPIDNVDNGTLVLNPNGTFTYTPNPNYNGTDQFQYQICDDGIPSLCDTATVLISINPFNDKPIANDDIFTTDEDTPINNIVLPNDNDIENDHLIVNSAPVDDVDNGILVLNPNGTFTYTPDPNYNGNDQFQYQLCDNGIPSLCDTATVFISINPINDKPVANDDSFFTNEDEPTTGNVIPNDTDTENGNLTVTTTPIDDVDNGTLVLNPDGTFMYIPDPNYNGNDQFQYEICDDGNPILCDTATVFINIGLVNDAPLALPDTFSTDEDVVIIGMLILNDSDPDANNIILNSSPVQAPANGTVVLHNNGSFNYTPAPGYYGDDIFHYQICDNGIPSLCDTTWVYITINPVNDAPYAINDVNIIPQGDQAKGNVLDNDFDIEGDDLIVKTTPIETPNNGTVFISPDGSYVYTPDPDFVGEDVFQYEICDNGFPSFCDTATVTIDVINNMPGNNPPVGINDVFVTIINQPIFSNLTLNDFDPDGDNITITTVPINAPLNGSVIINNNGFFEYTPNNNFLGDDDFTYRICDDGNPVLCDIVTVTVTVIPSSLGKNTTYANDDVIITKEDVIATGNLIANDVDPENHNQFINPTPIRFAQNGKVQINLDGTYSYTPKPDYYGFDEFAYWLCDNGTPSACDSATVRIIITSENDPPVAINDINNTIINTPVTGNVLTNDLELEGDSIILNSNPVTTPNNGTVVINEDGSYEYTPNNNFFGEDVFSYQICDDVTPALCDTAQVVIEILNNNPNFNNPPNGVEDNFQTYINQAFTANILSNDSDIDGDNLVINTTPTTLPSNGSVSINNNGNMVYTPNVDFIGIDQFMYEVCDDQLPALCDQVIVTIDVLTDPFNTPIIFLTDDAGTMWENESYSGNLLANDYSPTASVLNINIVPVVLPVHGLVTINTNGDFTYTPFNNYNGPDHFLYSVCDATTGLVCDTATAYMTILPLNDAPIAKNDINLTIKNILVSGQVLTNDEEPDHHALVVSTNPLSDPQNGVVSLNTNGSYTYQPNNDFVGEDHFEYIVCDDQVPALCDTAKVTIQVIDNTGNQNHPPIGVDDVNFGLINTALSGNLLSNDSDPDGDAIKITPNPISSPSNGAVSLNPDGSYTYVPQANFVGADEFRYEVCDVNIPAACDTAVVYIEIFPLDRNTIFANDDAASGDEDTPISGNLLENDFDPEGDNITIRTNPISLPNFGSVSINSSGEFTYLPVEDYFGPDQFEYEICDDGNPQACDIATAYLTVLPVNDTLCATPLPKPTILSNGDVCFTENIFLFIQENYPLVNIENTDLSYRFLWYNGFGDEIGVTAEPNFTIAANHPGAISPFTIKVELEECSSSFADPIAVNITQLPTIIATTSGEDNAICKNSDVQLFVTTVANANYEWRVMGRSALISTDQNPIIIGLDTTTTFEVMVHPLDCDTSATATIEIQVQDRPTLNPQILSGSLICEGSNVQLAANPTGNAPYTFQWIGPNNYQSNEQNPFIPSITDSKLGTYMVQISDQNNCTANASIDVNIINPALEKPSITSNGPVCSDGIIELSNSTPYAGTTITYNWINGLNNTVGNSRTLSIAANDPAAVSPFIFKVTVDGCAAPDSDLIDVSIQGNNTLAIATSERSTICQGASVQLFSNEVNNARYEWRELGNATIISTLQNPIIGNIQNTTAYTLTVRGEDCTDNVAMDTLQIAVSPTLDFTLSKHYALNIDCSPSDLHLNVSLTGNLTNLSYRWTGPNGFVSTDANPIIEQVTELYNGIYSLEVSDQNGCSKTKTIQVNDIQGTVATPIISVRNVGCAADNIVLEVPVYNGSGVIYNWFENGTLIGLKNTNQLFVENAQPGSFYTVTIKIGGCLIESDTLYPPIFERPIVNIANTPSTICSDGSANITLDANISGGQAPYEITWSGPNNFSSFSEDPTLVNVNSSFSGIYSIEITDQNGCTARTSTEIDVMDTPLQPSISLDGNACENSTIRLNVPVYEGNNIQYQWQLPNGQIVSGSNELILPAANAILHNGTYNLTVSINGCSSNALPFDLDIKAAPSINPQLVSNASLCEGNKIELLANPSGQGPFSIQWQGPNDFSSNLENPIINNITSENLGLYAVEVRDINNCISSADIEVDDILVVPEKPIINAVSQAVCINDNIEINTSTIYNGSTITYNWINGIGAVISIDRNLRIAANNPAAISPFFLKVTVNGCEAEDSDLIDIEKLNEPSIIAIATSSASSVCQGASVQLFANEATGYTYEWRMEGSDNIISTAQNPIIENIQNDTEFTLTIRGDNCTGSVATDTVKINVSPVIDFNLSHSYTPNADCSLADLQLNANLISDVVDLTFKWTGPNNFSSTEINPIIRQATSVYNGTYTLEISNTNNCNQTQSILINGIQDRLPIPVIKAVNTACEYENITLEAPEYTGLRVVYNWYKNDTLIEFNNSRQLLVHNAHDGTFYKLSVQVDECLVESDSFRLNISEPPSISLANVPPIICSDGQEDINIEAIITGGQAPFNINWTGPNGFKSSTKDLNLVNANNTSSGIYAIEIVDQNGCTASASTQIDIKNAPLQPIINSSGPTCEGNLIKLSVPLYEGVNISYNWQTPSIQNITGLNSNEIYITPAERVLHNGDYIVTVDIDGCSSTSAAFTIDLKAIPTFNPTAIYTASDECASNNLELRANITGSTNGLDFQWTGPNGFTSSVENPVIVNANPDNNGIYELTISNSLNCTSSAQTNLIDNIVASHPEPIIQSSEIVCEGGLMTLTAPIYTGNSINYNWLLNGESIEGENSNEITIGPIGNENDRYQLIVQVDDCTLTSDELIPTPVEVPNISLGYEISSLCEGGTLQFTSTLSNVVGNIEYDWTGPNGFTSKAPNPFIGQTTNEYNGSYTLTITTLSGCKNSKSIIVNGINNIPERPIVMTNSPVCGDEDIFLGIENPSSNTSVTYLWLNGDGDTIGKTRNITILANDALAIAPYFAEVTIPGCPSISSMPIEVEVIQMPSIFIDNTGPICLGEPIELKATLIDGATYTWSDANTGRIVSTENTLGPIRPDTTTTFNLSITRNGCNEEKVVSTTVEVLMPLEIANMPSAKVICEGQDLILTAENTNPSTQAIQYTWTGPNNFSYTNESSDNNFEVLIPSVTMSHAGTYELVIGSNLSCASQQRSVIIGINEALITPTIDAETQIICSNSDIIISASTENGPDVSYEWYQQDANGNLILIQNTNTPSLVIHNASPTNSGMYLARVLKKDCISGYSNAIPITVIGGDASITATNNTSLSNQICEGELVQLSVPFIDGATYTWFGPAGFTSDMANPAILSATVQAAGDYYAIISVEGCASITSSTTTVYVKSKPFTPTISNNGPACVGESIILEVNTPILNNPNDTISFEWYNAASNTLVATTTVPQLFIENATEASSGNYYLRLIINGCTAEPSNVSEVLVLGAVNLIADAGSNQRVCAASSIDLAGNEVPNTVGKWTSLTGATFENSNTAITTASNLRAGINLFVWTLSSDFCNVQAADTVEVRVDMLTADIAFAGTDQFLCEETSHVLAATPLNEATGLWTQSSEQLSQGINLLDPTNPNCPVAGLQPGNTYSFTWTISQGSCVDFASDVVIITVDDTPPENALIPNEEIVLCGEDQLNLNVEIPTFSTGIWTTNSTATIAAPMSPTSFVENLQAGSNVFYWSLSNGACQNFSIDSLIIYSESAPIANDDDYITRTNDTTFNVLENDVYRSFDNLNIIITKQPDHGVLSQNEDGTIGYLADEQYFGFDDFKYTICIDACETLCDSATVSIQVNSTQGSGDCRIPNVMSPNNDGKNDFLTIACIDQFPDNQLKIFNRWGDKIYDERNYDNKWAGTYNDQPLPPGTYFYVLQLREDLDPIQGFITIFR